MTRRLSSVAVAALLAAPTVTLASNPFTLVEVGNFAHTAEFDSGASEISSYDPGTQRLFVVNGEIAGLDVLDISDPASPTLVTQLTVGGGEVTSCAVANGVVAVTASTGDGLPGTISFFATGDLTQLGSTLTIGPTPDSVLVTPGDDAFVIAHEGEPDYEAGLDPDGSIGIFRLDGGITAENVAALTEGDLQLATFDAFNGDKDALIAAGVRIYGDPEAAPESPFNGANVTVAQDLEPEFITFDPNGETAWVTLQENNALAIVDLEDGEVTDIVPLGRKDHSVEGQGLDASDRDEAINITEWPVNGMYMSDALSSYQFGGDTYLVLANEGDDRSGEDVRLGDLFADGLLDVSGIENPDVLFADENLGRLDVSIVNADTDGDGLIDEFNSFGARSFTIRDEDGEIVFDSGDMIEQIIATEIPGGFNCDNDDPEFDNKSDSQGPEPEGITVGRVGNRTLCFVGFEDVGGVMIFDVTNPHDVRYESYINDRSFDEGDYDTEAPDFDVANIGNTGPEGITFISAADSPNGEPLVVVSYEVTGTTGIYQVVGPECVADLNGNGFVGFADLLILLQSFGECDGCVADLDRDGVVSFEDLIQLLDSWGPCD